MKKISAIVINYNTPDMTARSAELLLGCDRIAEVILIDNGSSSPMAAESLADSRIVYVKNQKNLGFAAAVNQGMDIAKGETILLVNSDVMVNGESIAMMADCLERDSRAGIVGPQMRYPDGTFQVSCGNAFDAVSETIRLSTLYKYIPGGSLLHPNRFNRGLFSRGGRVGWVSGGCMMLKRELVDMIGNFDEKFFFGIEDVDFCYRATKAGWKVAYLPQAHVVHYHGYSSGGRRTLERMGMERDNLAYFLNKHFPRKLLRRKIIRFMHTAKISFIKYFDNKIPVIGTSNHMKAYQPIDATIAITYKCNSRCQMCNIWQDQHPAELPLEYFRNLAPTLRHINLSGGEPFLRPDLPEIVSIIRQVSPKAQIIISSNGLATELIRERIRKIKEIDPSIGVRISIDGIGLVHDKIRGIPGMFEHAIATVKVLKEAGVSNLGLSFTIMDDNAGELPKVYDLSRELGIEMALALVQNSDIYFQKDSNRVTALTEVERDLTYLIKKELASWKIKRWLRAFYDYGLLLYARKQERLLPTGAGKDSLFIDPSGAIYPSNLISLKLGNLGTGKLQDIWYGPEAEAARRQMEAGKVSESWIICTIRGEMKRHLPTVGWWILKHKFLKSEI